MRVAAAFLYAATMASLLTVFVLKSLDPTGVRLVLGAGALVGAASLWQRRPRPLEHSPASPPGPWEWLTIVAFTLFALRAFLWLVFFNGDEVRFLSPNNLGDLSLHLTYIEQLANGARLWPQNPILANTSLTYPLGVDLLHSLFVVAGADLWRTFIWFGLAGSGLTGALLWRWGRGFALAGFLANGGLAGFAILASGRFEDYQDAFAWKSIPLALFVTQRGLLLALPIGLALLCSWRARFFRRAERPLPLAGEILLYAGLPLFHLHTFIALSFLLAVWFVIQPSTRKTIALLVGAAFVPATALVSLITDHFHGQSMLGWNPGWMQGEERFLEWCRVHFGTTSLWLRLPAFWLMNFGALPAGVALLVWRLWRAPTEPGARATVGYALGLFGLCCFVKFAVWEWDNTKLMIWAYLLVLPFLWQWVLAPQRLAVRGLAVVLLFGSGFVSLLGGLGGTGYALTSRQELVTLAQALRGIDPEARFVGQPIYNHPLLLLGHPMAMGYEGHVTSHGYDSAEPMRRIQGILRGEPNWQQEARALKCRYLFWGAREREAYPESPQPWRETARLLASGTWGECYDLESPPDALPNETSFEPEPVAPAPSPTSLPLSPP